MELSFRLTGNKVFERPLLLSLLWAALRPRYKARRALFLPHRVRSLAFKVLPFSIAHQTGQEDGVARTFD